MKAIDPIDVVRALTQRREIALLDLREEARFAEAHPLFAASMPIGQLEAQAFTRIPRRTTPIVVYDDGEGLVDRASGVLHDLGYSDVRQLGGGLGAWRAAGLEVFQDVNSASKAFGELVESRRHTPMISAEELQREFATGGDIVVVDARRYDEYRTMNIPGSTSVPGGELVLRAAELAPDPSTRIVVNCAGRTRSIIGAQSLINAGFGSRVVALRNGTIGWSLAGLELETGADRQPLDDQPSTLMTSQSSARDVAYRAGVGWVDGPGLAALVADPDRTTYLFDVRGPEAFEAGHIAGFRNAPGGQLVQETDAFAPVRGARIVLHDPLQLRADMTASWLAQMGWDVFVLEAASALPLTLGAAPVERPDRPAFKAIEAKALAAGLARGMILLDLAASPERRAGHIPGSRFVLRSDLDRIVPVLPAGRPVALTSPDGFLAAFAAHDPAWDGVPAPLVLNGGTAAWQQAGRPLLRGLGEALSEPADVYRRPYEGTQNSAAAMQAYLDWEYGLVDQLRRDRSHRFFVA